MKFHLFPLYAAFALSSSLSYATDLKDADASKASPETGIALSPGFSATVFADEIGPARHIAIADDGWVYAALFRKVKGKGGVALKDDDGDGKADQIHYFAEGMQGTGIELRGGYLYYGANQQILRFGLQNGIPGETSEEVVSGFPAQRAHSAKPMTFDQAGHMYVNVGVPSNNCMAETRVKGSPGQTPCPELENHGGIYRFDADALGQTFEKDGYRYSTGHRNANAIDWNPHANSLFLVQHGRDQLGQFFPDLYDDKKSAELPAEEFHRVTEGANLGWPFSYYDQFEGKRMVSPEYGGDGKTVSDIGQHPILAFPGHWAPNDVFFIRGAKVPDAMKYGALIAFHGSWNRSPFPQAGYRVAFVPMTKDGAVAGDWITFADGFAGPTEPKSARDAKYRPMGLGEGPDGALYITSAVGGRIWRVTYQGAD